MSLSSVLIVIADIIALAGVVVIGLGALGSLLIFVADHVDWLRKRFKVSLNLSRRYIVERTILSLDFFVAADIIRTIIQLNFRDLGLLAGIILIRIILAYFLERELGEELPE